MEQTHLAIGTTLGRILFVIEHLVDERLRCGSELDKEVGNLPISAPEFQNWRSSLKISYQHLRALLTNRVLYHEDIQEHPMLETPPIHTS
jgi:hypothetical protein